MASDGKRPGAVVIGVGAGLGAALARRFAKGYRVAMIARSEDYLAKLAKEIAGDGGEAHPVPAKCGFRRRNQKRIRQDSA